MNVASVPSLSSLIELTLRAGAETLRIYRQEFAVSSKDDRSPLTEADTASHCIVTRGLENISSYPVISEEQKETPYNLRKKWETFWLVDPLDGTREFIKRNGEFTVNIALVHLCRPLLGVIYAPVPDVLYYASHDTGAYKLEQASRQLSVGHSLEETLHRKARRLPLERTDKKQQITVIASRSHMSPETEAFIAKLREQYRTVNLLSAGSSLKLCLIAEGTADVYPRFAPTMEWDTAAGQAIVEAAGGQVLQADRSTSLFYNKEDLRNPWFIVLR